MRRLAVVHTLVIVLLCSMSLNADPPSKLDNEVRVVLKRAGFTGTIQSQLERRLGRRIDVKLADLGRLLWFDKLGGLHSDNTCGGCHSPTNGFGDTESIAIGVQNNNKVGPNRSGPRNQRRTPSASNTAFYPNLMWNGRFSAISGDPFDNSQGFLFPNQKAPNGFPHRTPDSNICLSLKRIFHPPNSWKLQDSPELEEQ